MSAPLLAILGGTFDPVHLGHLQSLWEVSDQFQFDEVHLIPCSQSPFKTKPQATDDQRLAMLELAIEGQTHWKIDEREIARGGISYMVDTLKSLHQTYPKHHLCLLMAVDAVEHLQQWNRWQEILSHAHLVVMTRPDYKLKETPWTMELERKTLRTPQELREKKSGGVCWTNPSSLAISSTQIRDLCAMNRVPDFLVPTKVADYLKEHRLYQPDIL